jgi:2-polyprenyl-3-methyl-5-hydroxy-6-metoxy-1,4-benzoquinol methylase
VKTTFGALLQPVKSILDKESVETPELQPPPPALSAAPEYSSAVERIRATGSFDIDDIPLIASVISEHDIACGSPWDDFRHAHLRLPAWFRHDLNPLSEEYAEQQHKLWSTVAGVSSRYRPEVDELEAPLADVDAVRRPGYFVRRDPEAVAHASQHLLAAGMILANCGLKPGDTALEYGAGFAHASLELARLGVIVDTVDVSKTFCQYVKQQADFFQVSLTPFEGRFGWNPREAHKYKLILFYESFHHCVAFKNVVHELKQHLAAGGSVLLAGEPIPRLPNAAVPYPWGLRLNSEPVAQVRRFHWFELGFTEDFTVQLFTNAGFTAKRIECPMCVRGEGYTFKHRGAIIEMAKHWLPHEADGSWHAAEADGRWTRETSWLALDSTESFNHLVIEASNHHPLPQSVEILYGVSGHTVRFAPGERRTIGIGAVTKAARLSFRSRALVPAADYGGSSTDRRALGIFIHTVRYAEAA